MIFPVYDGYPTPKMPEPPAIPPVKDKGNVGDDPNKKKNPYDEYKNKYPSGSDNVDKKNTNDKEGKKKCDSVTISEEGRRLCEEMMKKKQHEQ